MRTGVYSFTVKPTRHRFTQEQLAKGRRKGNITRWGKNQLLNPILRDDPAIRRYLAHIAARRGNAGKVSRTSQIVSCSAPRAFLEYLGLPIEQDSVSRLVAQTRAEHRNDIFQTDEKLLAFALDPPSKGRYNKAATVKGIFKANHCPLSISLPTPEPPKPTKKIDSETLKAIYMGLPRDELRAIIDLQAHAGERVACLCELTPISEWTDHGKYVLVHIASQNTKARYTHVSIIPKPLADCLRAYARVLGRTTPFPNYETLWREIRQFAIRKFGIRLTSHYLRKRFATIASKTSMPVNSWDYLMGDKPSLGHHAEAYALEDYSGLVEEYDHYLAPYLSIPDMKEPDKPNEPPKTQEVNALLKTIETLQETIKTLSLQVAEARTR